MSADQLLGQCGLCVVYQADIYSPPGIISFLDAISGGATNTQAHRSTLFSAPFFHFIDFRSLIEPLALDPYAPGKIADGRTEERYRLYIGRQAEETCRGVRPIISTLGCKLAKRCEVSVKLKLLFCLQFCFTGVDDDSASRSKM